MKRSSGENIAGLCWSTPISQPTNADSTRHFLSNS